MRETKAKGVAFGTGVLILGAVSLFAVLQQEGSAVPSADAGPPGPEDEATAETAARPSGTTERAVPPPPPAQDSVLLAGRAVYDEQSCAVCHSIAGEGSPRSPLDGVGARLTADEIRLWIVDPQAARPGVRKPAFDDLPENEVDALVAYLQTLTQ